MLITYCTYTERGSYGRVFTIYFKHKVLTERYVQQRNNRIKVSLYVDRLSIARLIYSQEVSSLSSTEDTQKDSNPSLGHHPCE